MHTQVQVQITLLILLRNPHLGRGLPDAKKLYDVVVAQLCHHRRLADDL